MASINHVGHDCKLNTIVQEFWKVNPQLCGTNAFAAENTFAFLHHFQNATYSMPVPPAILLA